ncbi:MAG: dockerin type I repeat-containing protein [Planctomycetota bacterium]
MKTCGWATVVLLGSCSLAPVECHAGLNILNGPTQVHADATGCFAFDYTYTVGPGGTEIAGILLGGNDNTTVPGLVIDFFCITTFPEGEVFVYPVAGCLVDPLQAGLITIILTGCDAGEFHRIETLVLPCCASPQFKRGDCNADGAFNVADAVTLLGFLFGGGPSALACESACDANDDGSLNIADAVAKLGSLFGGAGPLPAPTSCGADPTADGLQCATYPVCP